MNGFVNVGGAAPWSDDGRGGGEIIGDGARIETGEVAGAGDGDGFGLRRIGTGGGAKAATAWMDARELAIDEERARNMPKKPRLGVVGSATGAVTGAGAGAEAVEAIGEEADLLVGNSMPNLLLGEPVCSFGDGDVYGAWVDSCDGTKGDRGGCMLCVGDVTAGRSLLRLGDPDPSGHPDEATGAG